MDVDGTRGEVGAGDAGADSRDTTDLNPFDRRGTTVPRGDGDAAPADDPRVADDDRAGPNVDAPTNLLVLDHGPVRRDLQPPVDDGQGGARGHTGGRRGRETAGTGIGGAPFRRRGGRWQV